MMLTPRPAHRDVIIFANFNQVSRAPARDTHAHTRSHAHAPKQLYKVRAIAHRYAREHLR